MPEIEVARGTRPMGFAPRSFGSRFRIGAALPHHVRCTSRPDFGRACSIARSLSRTIVTRRVRKGRASTAASRPGGCRARKTRRRLRADYVFRGSPDLVPPGIAGHKELRAPAAPCCLRAPGLPAHGTRDPPAPHQLTCCIQQDLWGGGARSGRSPDIPRGVNMLSLRGFFTLARFLTPTFRR